MEAPAPGLSPEKFNQTFKNKHSELYIPDPKDGAYMVCKKCGAEIQQTTMYVSVHDKEWDSCAGSGEGKTMPLPFCLECEGKPSKVSTCVHV